MHKVYSIIPLLENHMEEICNDIKKQVDDGIAECPLFIVQLDPHGNPPVLNSPEEWCQIYDKFKNRLQEMGVESGILIQRCMFHPNTTSDTKFQDYINLSDGEPSLLTCPLDPGFREYLKETMAILAKYDPAVIMIDDDFRLLTHGGGRKYGCCCPRHLSEFNTRAGTSFSREELLSKLQAERNSHYAKLFAEIQKETLLDTAKIMRDSVDSVNPKLPITYCTVGGEFASEITNILAGEGNPVIYRLNNSCYSQTGLNLAFPMMRAAIQIAATKDSVDAFLAETDTCPQNRYSKSAQSLHAHYTGSILEGATGAKHWLTRTNGYEPNSGIAYRKILSKYSGFYKKLMEIVPTLSPLGCRIPLTKEIYFDYSGYVQGWDPNKEGWASHALEQLGLPLYFSEENGGGVFLDGSRVSLFSDEEIQEMLSGTLFISSDVAQDIINRGYGKHIGVTVHPFDEDFVTTELIGENHIQTQISAQKLVPTSDNTKVLSSVLKLGVNSRKASVYSPAVTEFKNELGGTVYVFCGVPASEHIWNVGYSFLNEGRKKQLADMLKATGNLPAYYPGDEPVYLRVAKTTNNELFCAIFNVGLDPIEKISLYVDSSVKEINMLSATGTFVPCKFDYEGSNIVIDTPAHTLEPVILLIKQG